MDDSDQNQEQDDGQAQDAAQPAAQQPDTATGDTTQNTPKPGTAASHPVRSAQPFLVAPTTVSDFNTLSMDLVPVACLSFHDIHFEFDSSFPLPETGVMLKNLPDLREKHKNSKGQFPPISIFGHADPVGGDAYNKPLSGRRARAIYGLLTHDTGVWEDLYNEEWHTKNAVSTMSHATGQPAGGSRKALMLTYMAQQFPDKLETTDFLGQGADPDGRADYQGCSDLNPLVVLSVSENSDLPHDQRNAENQPNRRVLVFLFRPGSKANPALWPCPAADDPSIAACKARFFGPPQTGDKRRKPGAERREFVKTEDTFACRFYDRVARVSPCEKPGKVITITIRLFDDNHKPMVGTKYKLVVAGSTFQAETNDKGILSHQVPASATSGQLILDMWTADLVIAPIGAPGSQPGFRARLENLGYHPAPASSSSAPVGSSSLVDSTGAGDDPPPDPALMRFQSAYGLPIYAKMNDDTKKKLTEIYGS
jgi:outer membrane protein OmpA-like peptidoglycan-associated protein